MLAQLDRSSLVVGSALGTAMVGGISGEHVATIAMITAFVTMVAGGFAWLDARMDTKITKHADDEAALDQVNHDKLVETFRRLLAEERARTAERE